MNRPVNRGGATALRTARGPWTGLVAPAGPMCLGTNVNLSASRSRSSRAARMLPVIMLALVTALALAAGAPPEPELFQLQQVRPGVYAAIAKPITPLNCNAAVIVGERDVLIVDS